MAAEMRCLRSEQSESHKEIFMNENIKENVMMNTLQNK
jgi:hypothetical protein